MKKSIFLGGTSDPTTICPPPNIKKPTFFHFKNIEKTLEIVSLRIEYFNAHEARSVPAASQIISIPPTDNDIQLARVPWPRTVIRNQLT